MNKRKIIISIFFMVLIIGISTISMANDIVVILDPGHGGWESGAVGGGILEKDVNWKIAVRVKEIFDATPGITGILARGENDNPSLYERGMLAKNTGADLLVSFHINSSASSTNLSGAEVYITGNTNSPRFYESSNKLGYSVLENLRSIGIPSYNYKPLIRPSAIGERYSDGALSDYYGIIRNPMYHGIPGVLIEHCFINNPSDRAKFLTHEKIMQMAEQDAKAIISNKELFRIDKTKNSMNSSLNSIQVNDSNKYLTGNITAIDWINGMQSIPNISMRLVSTDGEVSKNLFVHHLGGYEFYFDLNIDQLDMLKEYKIEVKSLNTITIPTRHTMNVFLADRIIGNINNATAKCENNQIVFDGKKYEGSINTQLENIQISQNRLEGNLIVVEWIEGVSNIPNPLPKMRLKSTDGSKEYTLSVEKVSAHDYKFKMNLGDNFDITKQYNIEIESGNRNNIGANRKSTVIINDKEVGMYRNYTLIAQNSRLKFELKNYEGKIETHKEEIQIIKTNSGIEYISGKVDIKEIVNGTEYIPFETPKIYWVSEDESKKIECYVERISGTKYYFDRNISNIDVSQRYKIYIELSESNNISIDKSKQLNLNTPEEIGVYREYKVNTTNDSYIEFKDTYLGSINSEVQKVNLIKNQANIDYITGEIVIVEWVETPGGNKISTVPTKLPKITLESTDGTIKTACYISQISGNRYYFDRNISNIDKNKTYKIKVELTNDKNISTKKEMWMNFWASKLAMPLELGKIGEYKVKIENDNELTFKDTYIGNINSELKSFNLNKTSDGRKYISGNIVIVEWVEQNDGRYVSTIPAKLPKMTLKSESGKTYNMFVSRVSGNLYYFDRFIEGLDFSEKYHIEVELDDNKNTSTQKNMKLIYPSNIKEQIREIDYLKMLIEGNSIKFETIVKSLFKIEEQEKDITNEVKQEDIEEKEENEKTEEQEEIVIE